jgi:hypothetical protein
MQVYEYIFINTDRKCWIVILMYCYIDVLLYCWIVVLL